MEISPQLCDITACRTDAIINAANSNLLRGSGVCGAIFAAAGPELDQACLDLGGCEVGQAKTTPGFLLAAKYIIHTVGPVYKDGKSGEPELLAGCYRNSLAEADRLQLKSAAFPAVSTGIFGYPARPAAEIAVSTIKSTKDSSLELVVLSAFDKATLEIYEELLAE